MIGYARDKCKLCVLCSEHVMFFIRDFHLLIHLCWKKMLAVFSNFDSPVTIPVEYFCIEIDQ